MLTLCTTYSLFAALLFAVFVSYGVLVRISISLNIAIPLFGEKAHVKQHSRQHSSGQQHQVVGGMVLQATHRVHAPLDVRKSSVNGGVGVADGLGRGGKILAW